MDLHELDRLHDSATKGPWHFDSDGENAFGNFHGDENIDDWERIFSTNDFGEPFSSADASFIVALVNAYPTIRKHLLAAEKLAKAVEAIDEQRTFVGLEVKTGDWKKQRDAALSDYREALK